MAECSSNTNPDSSAKKWPCTYCTYLNWEASSKCVLCLQPRKRALLIEEFAPTADIISTSSLSSASTNLSEGHFSTLPAEDRRWPCSSCTYLNCRRTKRCVQCGTDRPAQYSANSSLNGSPRSHHQEKNSLSKALNKWSCSSCTFDNWPTASKCTICGHLRVSLVTQPGNTTREQSRSPPQSHNQPVHQRRRSDRDVEHQLERRVSRLTIRGDHSLHSRADFTSALDIYVRRFLANDPVEKLFFKAVAAISHKEMQMVNRVVDYLINEGNLQRALTIFEVHLMNQHVSRGDYCRVVDLERADSLIHLAKKTDCADLVKLIRRVQIDDDRMPCTLNCISRTRLFTKITQLMAIRDGTCAFKCQFIAHPHNFSIFNLPMPGADLSLAVQNFLFQPTPSIPPQFCYLDCFDSMANFGGMIVGRPVNFLMRNRGGLHSLYDSIFQCMFGVCDRFNILRAATKYTMHRSANLFKMRWIEHQLRMVRDCGLTVTSDQLERDWEATLSSMGEEDESPEPIHIWALAHVVCRPIIVCPMDNPLDVDQLMPLGGRHSRSSSPQDSAQLQENDGEESGDTSRAEEEMHINKPAHRQSSHHSYEGIYLPVLWAAPPVSRSPLFLCYRNGQFYAAIISDAVYHRDQEVQRFVRFRRSVRQPGHCTDSLFRFLTRAELENSATSIGQFILLGQCNPHQINIRREPHPFLPESLHFFKNWVQSMLSLSMEQNIPSGALTMPQLENRMDIVFQQQQQQKKRKSSGTIHQLGIMMQLFSPLVNNHQQQCRQQQQQFSLHGRASSVTEGQLDAGPDGQEN